MNIEEAEQIVKRVWQEHFGIGQESNELIHTILDSYKEEGKFYHNIVHIARGVQDYEIASKIIDQEMRRSKEKSENLFLAWMTHDIVYNSKCKDVENVRKSSHLAVGIANYLGKSSEATDEIRKTVLATSHLWPPKGQLESLIVDMDLAILGSESEVFWKYEEDIRKEYAWVNQEEFNARRASILKSFLQRQQIYSNPEFREKYESTARKNLQESITKLSK